MDAKIRNSHIFPREANEHYVEPAWCSRRLFEVERFQGYVVDPACGWGTIVISARQAGIEAAGYDIIDRGWDSIMTGTDFLTSSITYDNIVTNPPFDRMQEFVMHAVVRSRYKTAIVFPVARLPAAHWLECLPLARVYHLTPRPSMPPGKYIAAGNKPAGGRVDYCWLVFEHGHRGSPEMKWLHRDGGDHDTGRNQPADGHAGAPDQERAQGG